MKTIIISLLLFLSVNAQTIWYVVRDATGANTGRNWTDAWNYLDSSSWAGNQGVNWAIIQPGDTIYVSGGVDSTVYIPSSSASTNWIRPDTYYSFANGSTVIITKAWHTGHNGEVYFGQKNNTQDWAFRMFGVSNVKLNGFIFSDLRNDPTPSVLVQLGGGDIGDIDSLIYLENCHLISDGVSGGLYLSGSKTTVKNCVIEQLYNSLPQDQDLIGISAGRGGHTIDGCKIIYRNDNIGTGAHRDCVQWSNFGMPSRNETVDITIKNSLIIHPMSGSSWTAMIYSSEPYTNTNWYIYNNIIVSANTASGVGGIVLNQPNESMTQSIFIFNNIIIMNDDGSGLTGPLVNSGSVDTFVVKNNIVVMDAPVNHVFNIRIMYPANAYYRDIDYNAYYEYGGRTGDFSNGEGFGSYTYEQWQAGGYDIHSLTGNSTAVTFTDKYGETFESYYTETGRDLGVNLSSAYPDLLTKFPDLAYDILGNPRSGSWDIGALEYQDGAVDTVPSFSFTALNNQEINTAYIGSATFSGADSTFSVYSTTGARFNINSSSSLSTTLKTAVSGDVVYVETVTGSSYSTGYTETIVAGGVSRDFTVTTEDPPYVPPSGNAIKSSTGLTIKDNTGKVVRGR